MSATIKMSIRVPSQLHERLAAYSARTGASISALLGQGAELILADLAIRYPDVAYEALAVPAEPAEGPGDGRG